MTKNELSLLLYLETRAVNHGGLIDNRNINKDDLEIMDRWRKKCFIIYGRVCMASIKMLSKNMGSASAPTLWCNLSNDAWAAAAQERKVRASKMWEERKWQTTAEFTNPVPRETNDQD